MDHTTRRGFLGLVGAIIGTTVMAPTSKAHPPGPHPWSEPDCYPDPWFVSSQVFTESIGYTIRPMPSAINVIKNFEKTAEVSLWRGIPTVSFQTIFDSDIEPAYIPVGQFDSFVEVFINETLAMYVAKPAHITPTGIVFRTVPYANHLMMPMAAIPRICERIDLVKHLVPNAFKELYAKKNRYQHSNANMITRS